MEITQLTLMSPLWYRLFTGQTPFILLTDLDIMKQVMVKEFDSFPDRPVSNVNYEIMNESISVIFFFEVIFRFDV